MKLKINSYRLAFFAVAFVTLNLNAQDKPIRLKGLVKYDSMYLQDVNILNKATHIGVSSDTKGSFIIYAEKGDSILFSSLIFENRIIKITETHLKSKSITAYLEPSFNQLDEIMLDKKILLNSINIAVTKGTILNNDKITNNKPPNARKLTDPNANAGGINPISLFMGIIMELTKKGRLKRKAKRRKLKLEQQKTKQLKNEFSDTIKNLYGDDFFTDWLHVSEDKINLFLDYCEGNGFLELYNKDEIVIKDFLIKQAKKFNSIRN